MNSKKSVFKSLKVQICLFMTANVLVWFFITTGINEYIWHQEELGELVITNGLFTLLSAVQALLFIIINLPFLFFLINHIDKPVQKIVRGLRKIKSEKFDERIDFASSNEFDEIKNEINIMSEALKKSAMFRAEAENQKTLLFANMAHDLKTPITSIQGFSKALCDGVVESPEKQTEYINTIYSKAKTMNDLIDRLFEYVKINSDLNALNLQDADIAELLRNCVSELYTEFEERGIRLDICIPETPIVKSVDKVELHRVYANILTNVIVHNDDSIRCLIKMDERGNVIVADSGNAISEKYAEQIFQPFAKGDFSRKSGCGSGLGLSLSKKIMEKHNGDLLYLDVYEGYVKAFLILIDK
ncbi:MAG: HAMP domain-containing histidine kinase [Treponemataceae bacterium]|nr:HAMP domain-containing histidine kinase [Treponemataceae bacterium]